MSDTLDAASLGILPGTTGQYDFGTPGGAGSTGIALGTGAGQQGHQPLEGTMTNNPFVLVWTWLNKPFQSPMSPWDVMLLVGVVLIAILAWNLILYHIRIAAEAL